MYTRKVAAIGYPRDAYAKRLGFTLEKTQKCKCGKHYVYDPSTLANLEYPNGFPFVGCCGWTCCHEQPTLEITFIPKADIHVSARCLREATAKGGSEYADYIDSLTRSTWQDLGCPTEPGTYGKLTIHSTFPTWEFITMQVSLDI